MDTVPRPPLVLSTLLTLHRRHGTGMAWSDACEPFVAAHSILRFPCRVSSALADNQIIKLPTNKFTVREREMLTGSGIVPREFFDPARTVPFALGALVGIVAYAFVNKQLRKKDDSEDSESA